MVVIDSSVLSPAVVGTGDMADNARVAITDVSSLHAPELIYLETLSYIRRARRSRSIDGPRASSAVAVLMATPLTPHPQRALVPIIWELRDRCSAYDAAYVALAIALDEPLMTADAKLAKAAAGVCAIRLVDSSS